MPSDAMIDTFKNATRGDSVYGVRRPFLRSVFASKADALFTDRGWVC